MGGGQNLSRTAGLLGVSNLGWGLVLVPGAGRLFWGCDSLYRRFGSRRRLNVELYKYPPHVCGPGTLVSGPVGFWAFSVPWVPVTESDSGRR